MVDARGLGAGWQGPGMHRELEAGAGGHEAVAKGVSLLA